MQSYKCSVAARLIPLTANRCVRIMTGSVILSVDCFYRADRLFPPSGCSMPRQALEQPWPNVECRRDDHRDRNRLSPGGPRVATRGAPGCGTLEACRNRVPFSTRRTASTLMARRARSAIRASPPRPNARSRIEPPCRHRGDRRRRCATLMSIRPMARTTETLPHAIVQESVSRDRVLNDYAAENRRPSARSTARLVAKGTTCIRAARPRACARSRVAHRPPVMLDRTLERPRDSISAWEVSTDDIARPPLRTTLPRKSGAAAPC